MLVNNPKRFWIRLGLLGIAFLALLVMNCGVIEMVLPPTPMGGSSGKIVFISNRDDTNNDDTFDTDLYLLDLVTKEVTRITEFDKGAWSPDLSPDGTRVVYISGKEIFVMNIDGTNPIQLTNNDVEEGDPTWSPDGEKITFVAKMKGDSSVEIYSINPDGTEQERLTDNDMNEFDIAWSPDGTKIAFASFHEGGGYDIFVTALDDAEPTQVTDAKDFDVFPCWLDEDTIAYVTWYTDIIEPKRSFNIFVTSAGEEYLIFYTSDFGLAALEAGIQVINLDGTGRATLTDKAKNSYGAACSPDGLHILFTVKEEKGTNIYIMDADGSNIIPLTTGENSDLAPEW